MNLIKEPSSAVKQIENEYPEMAAEFKKIQREQYELFCEKQLDYGSHNITMGTGVGDNCNIDLTLSALIVRINDKAQRLINLFLVKKTPPNNEPLIDSFKDISVYSIMSQIVNRGKWGI
tara:strand:+ start:470 stop:826 length:357 start_codon:yes stop_codon:yes gene_type:complete